MDERIIIYDTSKIGFSTKQELIDYLDITLSMDDKNRFRNTQCKEADIIILSWKGLAFGHLRVIEKAKPNIEDIQEFRPVKCTYLINETEVYENPVKLYADLGIRVGPFGTPITQK